MDREVKTCEQCGQLDWPWGGCGCDAFIEDDEAVAIAERSKERWSGLMDRLGDA